MTRQLALRFGRFSAVGVSGGVLNMSLFWLLTSALDVHYLLAAAVAFEVAMGSNYMLNRRWTFADRGPGSLLRYQLASLAGLAVSLMVLNLATGLLGVPALLANALGIAAAMGWNFSMSLTWTWRPTSLPLQLTGEGITG